MLKDTDPMPFGMHEGKAMIEVPKNYLLWLFGELQSQIRESADSKEVREYVEDNLDAIQKESDKQNWEEKPKKGFVVKLKNGTKGIAYHNEAHVNGKVKVYTVTEKLAKIGVNLLCDPKTFNIIGYVD